MESYTKPQLFDLGSILKKVDNFLRNLPVFWFIILMTSLGFLIDIIPLFDFLPDKHGARPNFNTGDKGLDLFIGILFGSLCIPFVETFIGQKLPIYICNKFKYLRERKYLIILITALWFALGHTYSIRYIVQIFFTSGIILSYSYILYTEKGKDPFSVVFAIHALNNLVAFTLDYFV